MPCSAFARGRFFGEFDCCYHTITATRLGLRDAGGNFSFLTPLTKYPSPPLRPPPLPPNSGIGANNTDFEAKCSDTAVRNTARGAKSSDIGAPSTERAVKCSDAGANYCDTGAFCSGNEAFYYELRGARWGADNPELGFMRTRSQSWVGSDH